MNTTKIQWTDSTFNPWWGCAKVSPGCANCYAETFSKRVGERVWGVSAEHRRFSDAHWEEPVKWNRMASARNERQRVFCASMADVFEGRPEDDADRARLFALIEATPHLDWQLLTKRPENMVRLAPASWAGGWPRNVWAGCTVEDQAAADERIPYLLRVPASVRFLSCEPLLGPVDLARIDQGATCDLLNALEGSWRNRAPGSPPYRYPPATGIHWVIVGGESGPGARPMDLAWARSIVEQCCAAGVPVFVKQLGARPVLDGAPLRLRDRKGGDMAEWPEDLRVRQFPKGR